MENYEIIKNIENLNINSFFPDNRAYIVAEYINDDIFIHGGSNKSKEYSQIDFYDCRKNQWKSITDISSVNPFFIFDKTLSGHSSNFIQNSIIIYGGFDGSNYSNAIYIIDTDDYSFQQVDIRGKEDYPLARSYHSSSYCYLENCIYMYGGWNGNICVSSNNNFTSLWKYDIKYSFWEKIDLESNISLRGHVGTYLPKKIIVYGGITGFNKFNNNIYEINIKKKEISLLLSTYDARAFHSSALVGDKIIYHGGITQNSTVLYDLNIYNIQNNTFNKINEGRLHMDIKLIQRFGHKMILCENKIIVIGGYNTAKEFFSTQYDQETHPFKNIFIINLNI